MITPISQISAITEDKSIQQVGGSSGGMFKSVFQAAIDNVKNTEAEVVKNEYLMATGQLDNPAILSIAETKSAIAVDLLVQMRNKATEAYSELMRISL